ncbi:MAG TPA: DNA polymerase III subunit alpha [Symbiobacteriaceae bacterium]|nr:DNA polymerase III subunit alpha [Symbiobacteriaceae bacterium]
MSFVHLHVHSPFSFLDGASRLDALIEEAALQRMPALTLTDHDNVSGAVRFQKKCLDAGLLPIQGAELTLQGGHHLTLLATGPTGYATLCRIITAAHIGMDPAHMGAGGLLSLAPGHQRLQPAAPMSVFSYGTEGLIALSGCRRGEVPSLILRGRLAEAEAAARRYAAWFPGRFYLEVQDDRLPGERMLHSALRELGEHLGLPLVATGNVHYRTREEFFVHDLLTCVRTLTRLDQPHAERRLNAENYMKPPALMAERFRDLPDAVTGTLKIAEQCSPSLDLGAKLFPQYDVPQGMSALAYLRQLVYEGARRRYGRITEKVETRLEHELRIIGQLGYEDYFLLVWDVARYARSRGFRGAGRGSAADSAVAYCLFITDVDAIARGLLFERFMSLERAEKPDIDIDFDARYRDEVANYVYRKYGYDRVASVCTYNTFHARSAIRDLGKAMGFAEPEIDFLAKRMPYFAGADDILEVMGRLPELRQSGIPWHKFEQLLQACAKIARLPRFMGTHLGGLVISRRPLLEVTPLQMAAKGCAVCQFDKEYVEDLGLVKLDLLSLRTFSAVDDASRMLEVGGFDYERIPSEDRETYEMLGTGETVGVFQLESPAQRALQARLGADRFEDIVASVAIIRPGPIKGNMVEPFLARRHGQEEITYLHPKLEPILSKTYGVVLFQEQVIEIATAVAGFSPGEADQLRRVMTKARNKEDMVAIGRLFVEKAMQAGVDPAVADTIFSYVQGYASYGFCEAHAAAFANTAYKTAYLVRHHPAEYFAALMSAQPMGYYPINTLAGDAARRGAGLLPVDINRSEPAFTVEEWSPEAWDAFWRHEGGHRPPYPALGKAIRIGLKQVKGVGKPVYDAIMEGRGAGFTSLLDFCRKTEGKVPRDSLEALVLAGAFDCLHGNRRELLWQVPHALEAARAVDSPQGMLEFEVERRALPDFSPSEKYLKEYELLGLMVRGHYMVFAREDLKRQGYLTAAQAKQAERGALVKVAGVAVRPHRPPTKSGRIVVFLSLEDETGLVDLTIFEDVYQRYGHLIFTDPRPPLAALGRVERRGGHVSVTVTRVKALE